MIIKVDDKKIEKLVRNLYNNFPEASMDGFVCTDWEYKKFIFNFEDEDGKKFKVNLEKAIKGFKKFAKDHLVRK